MQSSSSPPPGLVTSSVACRPSQPSPALTVPSSAGCRLLWRGKLLDGANGFHGIAIIAHLFAVRPSSSPAHPTEPSPFDDPLSISSAADLCLDLEMMRGGDLRVLGEVLVSCAAHPTASPVATSSKGQGRAHLEHITVETPTDVRVYIDPRCPQTINWLEKSFCHRTRQGVGLRVQVGSDELVIFAAYPTVDPTRDSLGPRPALTLLLGKAVQIKTRRPRPDDPMPRESLFANKLRRTTSMPILGLGKESSISKPKIKPRPKTSKTQLALINGDKQAVTNKHRERAPSRARSPSVAALEVRSSNIALSPGRGGAKRARSASVRLDTSNKRSTAAAPDDDDHNPHLYVLGSPTPSLSTTRGGYDDEDEDEADSISDLALFRDSRASSVRPDEVPAGEAGSKRTGMQRSLSLPVGVFGLPVTQTHNVAEELEAKNKATLRKLVLAGLTSLGVNRLDSEFKEVFSITLKGVQFALRSTLKILPVDRTLAAHLVTTHARMYVAVPYDAPTLGPVLRISPPSLLPEPIHSILPEVDLMEVDP